MVSYSMMGDQYLEEFKDMGIRDQHYLEKLGRAISPPTNHYPVEVKVDEFGRDYVVISDEPTGRRMTVYETVKLLKKRRRLQDKHVE